ncbi:YihY/virulence factor BrkB family protein [Salinarimonas sp.]|uniref:YihY/virulence factor BrkB family protein n=1 Tax=Salinarimonas sp. TaxID=2766526 RepID=UPI00391B3B1E
MSGQGHAKAQAGRIARREPLPQREPCPVPVAEARAREPDRGRDAKSPFQIPWRGWGDIFWRVVEGYSRDRIGANAAGAAFFLVFAIVPTLAAMVSLFGLVADPATLRGQLTELTGLVPQAMLELMEQELERLIGARTDGLTVTFAITLGFALWIINSAVLGLFDALNVIFGEREKRSLPALYLRSFLFTIAALAFGIVVVNVVILVPVILAFFPLGPLAAIILRAVPALVLFFVANVLIGALMRFGPSRRPAQWRWITPGSLAASTVWLLGSAAFSYYVSYLADFSAAYGSLATIAAGMMWVWISVVILLVGAEIDAETELQTAHDTTLPPAAPLGRRGAAVADGVGEAKVDTQDAAEGQVAVGGRGEAR